MKYVSLHNHTTFSIGDGLIKPMELFERAAQFDQPAVAVTDHGTFAGMWDCLKASRKTGVKMIAGCEFYFVEDVSKPDTQIFHLVLLSKNAIGYRNLLTLNKQGYDHGGLVFKKAISRIDWSLLEKYRDGLICTTACGNGIVGQAIMAGHTTAATRHAERLQHIFGDDLALELQPHNLQRQPNSYSGPVNQQKINLALKKIGQELGIRCIVATDARYLEQEHHDLHDVLLCIVSGQPRASGQARLLLQERRTGGRLFRAA
jgi:DNA polymerase-3 subunit alpha